MHTPQKTIYTGQVDHVSQHHAFIIVDSLKEDILVTHNNLCGAMHQDTVKVAIMPKKRRGRAEGKVITIISRTHNSLVGCIKQKNTHIVVIPDHKRFHYPIQLYPNDYNGAQLDDKVVVQIKEYPTSKQWAKGKVTKVLGPSSNYKVETYALMEQYGLTHQFSTEIEKEVAAFPDMLDKQEIAHRRDFRKIPTFTIDPVDAKDFDDALSIRPLGNGRYEVGIHIADVSHYVKKDTPLDKEALKRGTSVYLVGNCVSMLPERLANDLCSLKPHTIRPAFSIVLTLDTQAKVQDMWVGETVIYSDKRFTYAQAQEVIETGKGDFYKELIQLNELAKKLRKDRITAGAIAFETTDINIELDKQGFPIQIVPKHNSITNKLIEEFMLLANTQIAEMIYKKKRKKELPTFVYRVHDNPDPDKIERFSLFVKQLGYSFQTNSNNLSTAFNHTLKTIEGTPHQNIIQTLAIRSMAQAHYTTEAKPHFGLAFKHYTHFTSPIRRYPDLVVHRLVKHYLKNNTSPNKTWYKEMTLHTSARERIAVEVERASIHYKQVLFMKKLEGKEFKGIISGVTEWGLYVEILENKCEGMVKLSALKNDYYQFDARNFCVRGKRTKKTYKLGDKVYVRVVYCDVARRTTDLTLVDV